MTSTFLIDQSISVRVPAETTYLEFIRYVISGAARRAGFGEADVAKIEIAIDEVCTNVIMHTYGMDKKDSSPNRPTEKFRDDTKTKNEIDLQMTFDGEKIVITVIDRGKPFSLVDFEVPSIQEYLNAKKGRGLGIYIVKTFMDQIEYDYKSNVGNRLSLIKYLETTQG